MCQSDDIVTHDRLWSRVHLKAGLHFETQLNCSVQFSSVKSYSVAGSKTAVLVNSRPKPGPDKVLVIVPYQLQQLS